MSNRDIFTRAPAAISPEVALPAPRPLFEGGTSEARAREIAQEEDALQAVPDEATIRLYAADEPGPLPAGYVIDGGTFN